MAHIDTGNKPHGKEPIKIVKNTWPSYGVMDGGGEGEQLWARCLFPQCWPYTIYYKKDKN